MRGTVGWKQVSVSDIQASKRWALNGGPFGSKLTRRDYVEEGVPVIRGVNLSGDQRFNNDSFVFVADSKADELRPNNAHPGDVLFTQRGTLGQVGLIPWNGAFDRYVISQSQMKLTVNAHIAVPEYIYYVFNAEHTKKDLINRALSAGVPHINLGILREFKIALPPLPVQQKIASILSAYDDLIENNQRRIAILEEMAQLVYREWFVHFRFPGHEKVRMVDSPLGKIPEGWEVVTLSELATIVMGQSPRSEFYNTDKQGLPFHQGVRDFSSRFPNTKVFCTVMTRLAERGDILLSVRAPVGRINLALEKMILGRGLCAIRPGRGRKWLVFHQLKHTFLIEDIMGGGTIFKAVTKRDVESIGLLKPLDSIAHEFDMLCGPMAKQIEILTKAIVNLRTTRDLLLPRLISGDLNVSELDIAHTAGS